MVGARGVVLACGLCLAAQVAFAQGSDEGCVTADASADFAARRFAQSAERTRAVIAGHPGCADARYLLAESLLRMGQAKESLGEYTAAARLRKPASSDLRNVALGYALLEDYADARLRAMQARDLAPQDPENWYVLGRINYSDGNFSAAVSCFEQTLRLDAVSVKAEDNLGLAYEAEGKNQEAGEVYRRAIAVGDQTARPSEQPLINLAILLARQGDAVAALPLLNRAVSIAPQDARAHEQLGRILLQMQQLPRAQTEAETAVALSPSDSRLHFLLGQIYRREGLEEKARAEFALTTRLLGTHSSEHTFPNTPN